MTNWQQIFSLSKANEALYLGDYLPEQKWNWPHGTWLQNRMKQVRRKIITENPAPGWFVSFWEGDEEGGPRAYGKTELEAFQNYIEDYHDYLEDYREES